MVRLADRPGALWTEPMTGKHSSRLRGRDPRRTFSLAMRGYDRREVDLYLARQADDPSLAVPAFREVMRGYNVEQVDMYIDELKAR
jgi:DivIVA domain-containing protein